MATIAIIEYNQAILHHMYISTQSLIFNPIGYLSSKSIERLISKNSATFLPSFACCSRIAYLCLSLSLSLSLSCSWL